MGLCTEANAMIDDYILEVKTIIQNSKLGEGLFGFGSSYKNNPCHIAFYDNVAALINNFVASSPDSSEAEEVAELIIKCSSLKDGPDAAYWVLVALQQLAIPLIPFISKEKLLELKIWYDDNFPRRTRLPIQKDLYNAIKKQLG